MTDGIALVKSRIYLMDSFGLVIVSERPLDICEKSW